MHWLSLGAVMLHTVGCIVEPWQALKCINRMRIKKLTLRVRQGQVQSAVDKLDKEVKLMLTLHHHNIVRLLEVIHAPQRDHRFMFLGETSHHGALCDQGPPLLPRTRLTESHARPALALSRRHRAAQCWSTRTPAR